MFKRGKGRNSLGLIDAAQNGDLARVKAKLKAGCDVNSRDEVRHARAPPAPRALATYTSGVVARLEAQRALRAWLPGCCLLRLAGTPTTARLRAALLSLRLSLTATRRVPLTCCVTAALPFRSGSSPLSCGRRTKGI